MIVSHAYFWTGVALLKEEYLKYLTGWTMFISTLTFTLLAVAHFREERRKNKKKSLEYSGLDSMDDSSTFIGFTPGALNLYSPTAHLEMDLELFRL